jgi:hypothetical protein
VILCRVLRYLAMILLFYGVVFLFLVHSEPYAIVIEELRNDAQKTCAKGRLGVSPRFWSVGMYEVYLEKATFTMAFDITCNGSASVVRAEAVRRNGVWRMERVTRAEP